SISPPPSGLPSSVPHAASTTATAVSKKVKNFNFIIKTSKDFYILSTYEIYLIGVLLNNKKLTTLRKSATSCLSLNKLFGYCNLPIRFMHEISVQLLISKCFPQSHNPFIYAFQHFH